MSREIPEPVRAAAGLAATVLDETRRLPETLPGLPVRVLGLAMQLSMKLQQHYAGLVARGDELLTGFRGEDEPGLATFDDDDEPSAAAGPAPSAFDRVAETVIEVVEDDGAEDAVVDVEPAETVLDDLAIEELVDEAPTPAEVAEDSGRDADLPAEADVLTAADALDEAVALAAGDAADGGAVSGAATDVPTGDIATGDIDTGDIATEVDVLTPEGDIETVEATVTDEGVAAPEAPEAEEDAAAAAASGTGPAVDTATESTTDATTDSATGTATETGTATDEGGTPVAAATGAGTAAPADDAQGGSEPAGSPAAATAPIEGYDAWSIAQLRGRLRGYQLVTVQDLVTYEEATRAREPYLRMLRNRLQKLEEQAVEASPLAPRGV